MVDNNSAQILIIEDDETAAEIICDEIRDLGFSVHVAHDGEGGMKVLGTHKIIAVILDLRLQNSTIQGLQLLDWIGRNYKDVPVVVTTAHAHLAARALEKGAANVLMKPVEAKFVVKLIDKEIGIIRDKSRLTRLEKELAFYRNKYIWLGLFVLLTTVLLAVWGFVSPADIFGRVAALTVIVLAVIWWTGVGNLDLAIGKGYLRLKALRNTQK